MSLRLQPGDPELLIGLARAGDEAALGRLLELYRNYLRLLARTQVGGTIRVRLDPSDLVQEAFLKAHRYFKQFQGATEREFMTWLRQILVRTIADRVKHHGAKGRDWRRQESLEALLDRSSAAAHEALTAGIATPNAHASRREQAVLLADGLARFLESYREVIILRHMERLGFEDIGRRMKRSTGAVRMLWLRALERLRQTIDTG